MNNYEPPRNGKSLTGCSLGKRIFDMSGMGDCDCAWVYLLTLASCKALALVSPARSSLVNIVRPEYTLSRMVNIIHKKIVRT